MVSTKQSEKDIDIFQKLRYGGFQNTQLAARTAFQWMKIAEIRFVMSASISHRAELIAHTLIAFIGVLYAARVTAAMWIQHAEQYPIAAKYSLQMTGGTILLTLRKV